MPKDFDIDEKIDVEIYRKSREILNSINFNCVTKSELHRAIDKLAQLDSAEFSAELKQVDFTLLKEAMKEMRDNLNSINLKESMTTREFYQDVLKLRNRISHQEIIINGKRTPEESYKLIQTLLHTLSSGMYVLLEDISRFNAITKQKP